jgi:hypothetical protein
VGLHDWQHELVDVARERRGVDFELLELGGAGGRVLVGDTEEDRGGAALGWLTAADVGTTKPSQPSKHALPVRLSSRRFMMDLLCTASPFSLAGSRGVEEPDQVIHGDYPA